MNTFYIRYHNMKEKQIEQSPPCWLFYESALSTPESAEVLMLVFQVRVMEYLARAHGCCPRSCLDLDIVFISRINNRFVSSMKLPIIQALYSTLAHSPFIARIYS